VAIDVGRKRHDLDQGDGSLAEAEAKKAFPDVWPSVSFALMNETADAVIARLGLSPLPNEGGFFRQTWLSPVRLANGRAAGSAIYFLVTGESFSALHQLRTDELWLFHAGDPIEHVQLKSASRTPTLTVLGSDFGKGHEPQLIVPGEVWQGARLAPTETAKTNPHGWALVSCVMAPAWDERKFTLGQRADLLRKFPEAGNWIHALTR
jgi:predicted cupin superfamily sugar epimerase